MAFQVKPEVIEAEQRRQAEEAGRIRLDQFDKIRKQQASAGYTGPGYQAYEPSEFELKAGVAPPGFRGLTDIGTGEILDRYKIDPFRGEASQALRQEAMGVGESPWTKMQRLEQAKATGQAGLQQQTAMSQARAGLARMGGLGGGARTSLARSGARDQFAALQGIGQQGQAARLGRRSELLGQTADLERQGDVNTQQQYMKDLEAKARFEANRYNQQMGAWGARETANATRGAGGGGGKK